MEYYEAVNALERLRRLRPKEGTETTAALLAHLGDPHDGLTCVQVAGSNGKGSTTRLLAGILAETGRTVGLYTSPDLNDLRHRVQVDGQKVPKREVVRFVEAAWPHVVDRSVESDEPTFFEAVTALALWHFGRQDVDVAVLEVGIGGRFDATSVVDPAAAAVTTVSLEHTDILGATVEEIARDKAQVAPAGRPLVTGATGVALDTIRETTDVVTVGTAGTDVTATEGEMISLTESDLSIQGPDWAVQTTTSLIGQHQAVNAGIAATLARQVAAPTDGDVAAGIRKAFWPGRFEVMDDAPLSVLDGAHNPAASEKLATLLGRYDYDDLHLVFGAMRDKNHPAVCRALPDPDRVYLAEPAVGRARATGALAAVFERETTAQVGEYASVLDALDRALDAAEDGDAVLVTGSLYVVAEARDRWTRTPTVVDPDAPAAASALLGSADAPTGVRAERASEVVDRTVRFHARRPTAVDLRETMRSLGGTGTVAGIATATEHVEVVLSGTLAQFRALFERLRAGNGEHAHLADQLAARVDPWADPSTDGAADRPGAGGGVPWGEKTAVMGVLNVTPDSFHDGGEYIDPAAAVARAEAMVAAGADVVDVGGESTRPGADPVPVAAERDRVVPVVERLADLDAVVSVDTRKPAVAAAALDAGAEMVNDVTGLEDAAMRRVVAEHDVPAVVMHSLSAPVDPSPGYEYDDVVAVVRESLIERVLLAERAGIDRSQLVVDPGLGFGKTGAESFELLDRLGEFRGIGGAVMVGHSRKSMFDHAGYGPGERRHPTVAATALAADRGADLVRVHDVAENVAAVDTVERTTARDRRNENSPSKL